MNTFSKQLGDIEFNKISNFVYSNFGIIMPDNKKELLQQRLKKRLREVNLYSFNAYCEYLFSHRSEDREVVKIIDLIK
jgi:chemotaxis protein methyltransferase CheR